MLPDKLPFYYQYHEEKGNGGFPDTLSFDIYFSEELQMFRQRATRELKEILHRVYQFGSLVEGSISNESGKVYIDKILEFIDISINLKDKSLLELGCGNGSMLVELQKKGAQVVGLEPGNHIQIAELRRVKIINDFFPSKEITGKFDIIFHYGVLEHIEDPIDFLKQHKAVLKKEGKIIVCVPNCEPFLSTGDVSLFIHEHYNYFTKDSLCICLNAAGFELDQVVIIEGMIAATATLATTRGPKATNREEALSFTFQKQFQTFKNKIFAILNTSYTHEDVAIYVPLRALNILYMLQMADVRLIDDSSEAMGKYLPYFSRPIENFDSLLENPPKCIIIFSRTFGARIKERCYGKMELAKTEIITLNEL